MFLPLLSSTTQLALVSVLLAASALLNASANEGLGLRSLDGQSPTLRYGAGFAFSSNGNLYLFGGITGQQNPGVFLVADVQNRSLTCIHLLGPK